MDTITSASIEERKLLDAVKKHVLDDYRIVMGGALPEPFTYLSEELSEENDLIVSEERAKEIYNKLQENGEMILLDKHIFVPRGREINYERFSKACMNLENKIGEGKYVIHPLDGPIDMQVITLHDTCTLSEVEKEWGHFERVTGVYDMGGEMVLLSLEPTKRALAYFCRVGARISLEDLTEKPKDKIEPGSQCMVYITFK